MMVAVSARAAAPVKPTFSNTFNALPDKTAPNLAVIVHGWTSNPTIWADDFAAALDAQLTNLGTDDDWDIVAFDWREDAAKDSIFHIAPANVDALQAQVQGHYLAEHIASQTDEGGYEFVHLFGHSLGGRVVQSAATALSQLVDGPTVQTTFFDAYTPWDWDAAYGEDSDFADHYINTSDTLYVKTAEPFPNAFNANVSDLGGYQTGTNGHAYPHVFYKETINDFDPEDPTAKFHGYGFPQSTEAGGSPPPVSQDGQFIKLTTDAVSDPLEYKALDLNPFSVNPFAENVLKDKSGANVTTADNLLSLSVSDTESPAWANLEQTVGDALDGRILNYLEFEFDFTSGDKDGVLAAYWNDTLIWAHREEHELDETADGWEESGRVFMLNPSFERVLGGLQKLDFRLDSAAGMSTVNIRNIRGGLLITVPEPASALLMALALATLPRWRRRPLSIEIPVDKM